MFVTPRVYTSGSSSVKVFVRTRPLLPAEYEDGARNIICASSADRQVIIEDGSEKSFRFEGVLEEDAGQDEVYTQAVAPLVTRVKEGCNATVLAYGQTGSGKTYTIGTNSCMSKENEGILQRALRDFLSVDENCSPSNSSISHELRISMVEIYSGTIFDLLASKSELKIRNEIGGGASIIGLVEEPVNTLEKGLALLERGSHLRSVGTTTMNSSSSRSHALIFLTLKHGSREGCLKLVDLAGAEGVGRVQSSGLQFTEGVNINKSLLTLGKVLVALSSSSAYVPYRESLLTRVLRDSLGGSSYTTMIACVNPSWNNIHETVNTLRYAEQARNIKARVQALATIKKRGAKRRLKDVSANAEVWKKRMLSTEKAEHNSTISTPGHKPSVRKLARFLNMTVTTCGGASDLLPVTEEKHGFNVWKPLFPLPRPLTVPSLPKPIIEDYSPSGLSTVSAIKEAKTSHSVDSPFMERLTNRLERTMMAQLENLQESIADSVITKLTQKNKGKQKRMERKIMKKSTCSTPTKSESSLGTDAKSSCDNILEETIAHATPWLHTKQENMEGNLPLTSTATCETRMEETVKKQLNEVSQEEQKSEFQKTCRRRSTRLEALKATQRNSVLLQGQSPLVNTKKKRRSCNKGNVSLNSVSRKASSSVLNATMSTQDYTVMASPRLLEEHNESILSILNTGNLRELQQLPTVGPKTAMVLSNFRKLYGKFSTVEEIKMVRGLSNGFYSRFLKANLITGLLQ